jgi:hypothetical protein
MGKLCPKVIGQRGRCVDNPNRAGLIFTESYVYAMRGRVVPQIVDVAMKIDFPDEVEVAAVEYPQFSFAARHKNFFCVRGIDNSLGIRNPGIE